MGMFDFNSELDRLCYEHCPFNKEGINLEFSPCTPFHQATCVILERALKKNKLKINKVKNSSELKNN